MVAGASGSRSALGATFVVVGAGLVVGIGTQVAQGELSGSWGVLANSSVMWALAAFALGAVLPTTGWAAGGGAAHLVVASFAYYEAVEWFEGSRSDPSRAIIWSLAGIVAGAAFGVAGHWCVRRPMWRGPTLGLVSGVLFAEGVYLTWYVGNPPLRAAGIVELAASVVVAVVACVAARRCAPSRGVDVTMAIVVGAAVLTMLAGKVIGDALAYG